MADSETQDLSEGVPSRMGPPVAPNGGHAGGDVKKAKGQAVGGAGGESRARSEALEARHMPRDFSISLDAYRSGGTDNFIGRAPEGLVGQSMRGFEPQYVNIIDYIVRITHRIWEEKDIGYIYDTYSHDCAVWDDLGLQYGRDKIVADTVHTNNAFPDIRIVADEVVWAGDETVGFHTSHRSRILGTNTGWSRFGPPTGKRIEIWCLANCVARANEIFHEHVVYDTGGILRQLGFDVMETVRKIAAARPSPAQNFMGGEPLRMTGQGKPGRLALPADPGEDIEAFVRGAFGNIWNRRDFSLVERVYSPTVVSQGNAGRVFRGTGQLRAFILSMVAMFPDIAVSVDDLYWMGNPEEGFVVSVRWSAVGTHRGHGPYGEPTGKQVTFWGISQWAVENGAVQKEWMMFTEFGVLMQIAG